ncbi:flagellar M-ring protein FliF [Cognatiyoonia koreensis]|uniref:Flagellar M-ring protein n=1 Tax=Cognatiyoonia koreensis TaxID=364200 RepID=A0A1I0RK88_9RHOB|nr:flagellar basal-body MS-ring/collar protein FliF [Cognatiyoonia koreensis]SEW41373.1 flagellar M-ring protein FliF [Cognatiyoonia koreensis]
MQGLLSVWTNLNTRRQIIAILSSAAIIALVVFLARGAGQKDLALLYGGLEPAAAGDVITALDQRGAIYEVRGGGIYVDATQRDSLRMSLAGEGLPSVGAQGYELLDGLSGFGTTSQMFDAAYWRAREGELARTILANPSIRAARVHISTPSGRPFQTREKPTAAVTVSTGAGGLSSSQITALQFLVGSAVTGLSPNDVAIIDDEAGLLSDSTGSAAAGKSGEMADTLRQRAERLLAARVGQGNALVEVSIDTINQSESILERTVDPDSRIAISTDVTETAETSQDSRGGNVTVASNLPDGDAAGGGGTANSENSETRALTNYEMSQTERQIIRNAGDVRRLTVAVLVNDVAETGTDGTVTYAPRKADELTALRELVSLAVGLDEGRGDLITVQSMQFEAVANEGTLVTADATAAPLNMMQLIQVAVAAVVALILGLFVVRPILSGKTAALPPPADQLPRTMIEGDMIDASPEATTQQTQQLPSADAVARLREMIAERETETVQLLQDWMEEPDPRESA